MRLITYLLRCLVRYSYASVGVGTQNRKRNFELDCRLQGLQAIRCPAGLAFDIEKQTCDWKAAVTNCEAKTKEKKVKPLLFTDEPICQENYLACGDGNCIERGLFCNGDKDCNDGSDENACGELASLTMVVPGFMRLISCLVPFTQLNCPLGRKPGRRWV